MEALHKAKLYVNKKKTKLFCYEIKFLGHKISQAGIEAELKQMMTRSAKFWIGLSLDLPRMSMPSLALCTTLMPSCPAWPCRVRSYLV